MSIMNQPPLDWSEYLAGMYGILNPWQDLEAWDSPRSLFEM